jgi:hypothetical protein
LLRWHRCFNLSEVAQSLLVQSELLGTVKASWGSREAAQECSPRRKPRLGKERRRSPGTGGKTLRFPPQSGYGVFSINVSNVAPVTKYIATKAIVSGENLGVSQEE